MPELKRVIAVHGDHLAMGEDLNDALNRVFAKIKGTRVWDTENLPEDIKALARQAYREFETAQKHLRSGAFSDYGQSVEALRETLQRMNNNE